MRWKHAGPHGDGGLVRDRNPHLWWTVQGCGGAHMQRKLSAEGTGNPKHSIPGGNLLCGKGVLPSTGLVVLCVQCPNPGKELLGISSH